MVLKWSSNFHGLYVPSKPVKNAENFLISKIDIFEFGWKFSTVNFVNETTVFYALLTEVVASPFSACTMFKKLFYTSWYKPSYGKFFSKCQKYEQVLNSWYFAHLVGSVRTNHWSVYSPPNKNRSNQYGSRQKYERVSEKWIGRTYEP